MILVKSRREEIACKLRGVSTFTFGRPLLGVLQCETHRIRSAYITKMLQVMRNLGGLSKSQFVPCFSGHKPHSASTAFSVLSTTFFSTPRELIAKYYSSPSHLTTTRICLAQIQTVKEEPTLRIGSFPPYYRTQIKGEATKRLSFPRRHRKFFCLLPLHIPPPLPRDFDSRL